MAYVVTNTDCLYAYTVVGSAETIEEAKALIPGSIICIEEDEDHPDHFDVFTSRGSIYTIEPAR